jgi:chromosome segregation ATPase
MNSMSLTQKDISLIRQTIKEEVPPIVTAMTEPSFRELRDDVGQLKNDVSVLKTDVSVLKTDVRGLKDDVKVLKTDVNILKIDMHVVKEDTSGLKNDMKGLRSDVSGLIDRSDEFLQIVRRHDQEWIVTRAQHQKLCTVLVDKGVVKEDDLAL